MHGRRLAVATHANIAFGLPSYSELTDRVTVDTSTTKLKFIADGRGGQ